MKQIYILTALLLFSIELCAQPFNAVYPVGATTSFSPAFGTNLVNSYNGSGLGSSPSLIASHAATQPSNSFISGQLTGTIDYDLGGSFFISAISFWTQNNGGPGVNIGARNVAFFSSPDGIVFTPIPGGPTLITANNPIAPSFSELFTFPIITTNFIRMQVIDTYGGPFFGIAEIAFYGNSVLSTGPSLELETVSLYPNPAEDFITISGILTSVNYTIYGVLGKIVLKGSFRENESIDIQNLDNGIYFLKLEDSKTIKFIKN